MDGSPRSIRRNRVSEVVVVAGGCAGEGVLAGHALGHVVANALAQAIVVVARSRLTGRRPRSSA